MYNHSLHSAPTWVVWAVSGRHQRHCYAGWSRWTHIRLATAHCRQYYSTAHCVGGGCKAINTNARTDSDSESTWLLQSASDNCHPPIVASLLCLVHRALPSVSSFICRTATCFTVIPYCLIGYIVCWTSTLAMTQKPNPIWEYFSEVESVASKAKCCTCELLSLRSEQQTVQTNNPRT